MLHALIGYVLPISVTSRRYLAKQLARHGVDLATVPEECIQELANRAVLVSKTLAKLKGSNWRETVSDMLEGEAINVASMIFDDRDEWGRPRVGKEYRDRTLPILLKHRVPLVLNRG